MGPDLRSHRTPTVVPAAMHIPVVFVAATAPTQPRPGWQSPESEHAAPAAPTGWQVEVALMHTIPGPQLVLAQLAPAVGGAAQVPQALPGAMPQKALAHWAL